MRFNIFDFYLFIIHKVTMYCPPINHKRFKKEFKNRYLVSEEKKINKYKIRSSYSKPLWIISHASRVYKSVKDYYMVGNCAMISQIIYILVLIHLFVKSTIHTLISVNDKETVKYFDSIYYPRIFGFSQRPYIFNHLVLGFSLLFLSIRILRMLNVIDMSMKNAEEYTYLRVTQLNSAYLASFYLNFREWLGLLSYVHKHESEAHSNRATLIKHLDFNHSVQQVLPKLLDRDAIFYVNPIDFDKCFNDSVLPNDEERIKRHKNWHFALPIDRVSSQGLWLTFLINVLGISILSSGYFVLMSSVIYLELRSEFSTSHSPSIIELIQIAPYHWSNLLHWVRFIEAFVIISSQVLIIFDLTGAFIDMNITTARVHRLVERFEEHVLFSCHQAKINIRNSNLDAEQQQQQASEPFLNLERNNGPDLWKNLTYDLCSKFNNQVRRDIASVRLVYHEFLNTKRYNTELFNISIVGEGICLAYAIPVIVSHPEPIEDLVLVGAILSSVVPVILILFYCARMERKVRI